MVKRMLFLVAIVLTFYFINVVTINVVQSSEQAPEDDGVIELWTCQDNDANQMCLGSDDSYVDGIMGCLVYPDNSESCRTTEDGFYFWDVETDLVNTLYVDTSESPSGFQLTSVMCHIFPDDEYELCTYSQTENRFEAEIVFDGDVNGILVSFTFQPLPTSTPTPMPTAEVTPTTEPTVTTTVVPIPTIGITSTPASTPVPTAITVTPTPTATFEFWDYWYYIPTLYR